MENRTPRLVGYDRVSTTEQNLDLQMDALQKLGCLRAPIFIDKISGAKSERPGLNRCLEFLQPGDVLMVWRLDRLGRSMTHLISFVEALKEKNVGFRSLCDGAIDTTTASGELVFNIFSSLAQFERRLIQECTQAGLSAARARGRLGGRKRIAESDSKVIAAKRMHKDKTLAIMSCALRKICWAIGLSSLSMAASNLSLFKFER